MIQNPCLRARVFWNKGKKYLFSIKPTEIRYGRHLSLRSGGSDNYRFSPRLHGSFLSGRIFNLYNPFTRNRAISLQIAVLFTPVRLIKQRRITRLHWGFYRANCAKTCPVEERLPFFKEISVKNFWQMVLDLKTKRGMGKSCTICKTPDNEWAWVETDHLPPYEQAWHWLTRQMLQRISVVLVKKAKR